METVKNKRSETNAIIWSGVVAGAVFMVLEMMMVPLFSGGTVWGPPRMIAAIALGEDVLISPATFSFGILMTAMAIHFALSIGYSFLLSLFIKTSGLISGIAVGAVFGLALYFVNFYGFTNIFPWFANARDWVSVTSHIVFGIVAAWTYIGLLETSEVEVTVAERESVEA